MALAGACSSSGKTGSQDVSGASTSTTATTATVQQVASIVAQHQGRLREVLKNETVCADAVLDAINDKAFNNTDKPSLKTTGDVIICNAMLTGLASAADSFASDLAAVKPPSEVSALTNETLTAARTLKNEANTLASCIPSNATSNDAITNCTTVDSFTTAAEAMKAKLAGWSPYGVSS